MTARARVTEEGTGQYEYYEVYRERLRREAQALRNRLKGTLAWATFFPIKTIDNLPRGAQIFVREPVLKNNIVVSYKFVPTKTFDPAKQQHYVKLPPFRNIKKARRPDRNTRALRKGIKNARRQIKLQASQARASEEQG